MWFIIDICSPKTWTESEFSASAGNTLLFAGLGITMPPLSPAAPSVFGISIIPWAHRKAGPAYAENISRSCKKTLMFFSVQKQDEEAVFFCPNANEDQPMHILRVFVDSQWGFICACVFMYIWTYECHFFGKHLLLWFHHSVDIHHAAWMWPDQWDLCSLTPLRHWLFGSILS